ncbi:MAG: sugar phosphate isomerase/epimerase [Alphaproteobacteria bacterium]|nr:sugar phosphate isomerase/epimerase [Alphaproteobacteria bacterium]
MVARARLSINTATVKPQWTLRQAIEGCARLGVRAVAPWRDKLQECGLGEAARLLADHGMTVSGLCRGGFFTAGPEALDDNRRAVDEAAAIRAQCLVLVCGGLVAGSRDLPDARKRIADGIARLLPHARAAGVPLAIEPLHPMYAADRAAINTLGQALDVCDQLGEGLGVAIDVYHTWWDPELERQAMRAGARILAYHICDWLVPTVDMLEDRGMMGDGAIDLARFADLMARAGYRGLHEVEIFSARNWWRKPGEEVVATCIARAEAIGG